MGAGAYDWSMGLGAGVGRALAWLVTKRKQKSSSTVAFEADAVCRSARRKVCTSCFSLIQAPA